MSWTMRRLRPFHFLSLHIVETRSFSIPNPRCRRRRKFLINNYGMHRGSDRWRSASSHMPELHPSLAYYSTKTTTKPTTQQRRKLEVMEFSASNLNSYIKDDDRDGVLRTLRSTSDIERKDATWDIVWDARETTETGNKNNSSLLQNQLQAIPKKAVSLLLPAQYPQSVAKGYLGFASFCFTASIAGSAAMVLSTQTLLLAVGIVGQSSTSTSVMAGALNWVMKDFVGQLGGVVFASQMGKTKAFDSDPKRWRMVSAIALDGATMLEIFSPLCHPSMVLPVASIANIGKNIGFLTASASRATLHQSLAVTGNLGDVTVKSGSQSMLASLVGTSLGIGLSTLLDHDTFNFGICFLGLSAIHQGCTYLSLQSVPLAHFNRHRLHLAMEYYLEHQTIPSPVDVAKIERFLPFVSSDSSSEWLRIGRALREVCQTPIELEHCLASVPNEAYLVRWNKETQNIDLIFFNDAKEQDLCRGVYHACLIRQKTCQMAVAGSDPTTTTLTSKVVCTNESTNRESRTREIPFENNITQQTHIQVQKNFPHLFEQLHTQGWETSSGVTDVEDKTAHRVQINTIL
jgi:hypothetical protein